LTRTPKPTVTFTLIPSSTSITTTKTLVAFTEVEDYIVKSGDYLWDLASKWGIDWQTLAALNNLLEPYIIVPGQVLKKPKITVTPTGTIAATLIVPLTGGQYVVQPGDTLMGLAGMWGIPWQELAAYNGLQPPYLLYSGQFLKIPSLIPTPKLP
jgi:LysM repeat protein